MFYKNQNLYFKITSVENRISISVSYYFEFLNFDRWFNKIRVSTYVIHQPHLLIYMLNECRKPYGKN